MDIKFLIIGLGSMGKRRVRNLQKIGQKDIIGFDIKKDRSEEAKKLYGVQTFSNFDKSMQEKPDVFIISCPPDKHLYYANYALDHNIHFFSEVNTMKVNDMKELIRRMKKKIIAVPSCTMRFHPCVVIIKKLIDEKTAGKPLLMTYHSGSNLEDWHPWEKITDYYVGKKETGGGRDQIMFELEWICWLLGNVKSVKGLATKVSRMKADIFDVYDLILESDQGVISNVLVDVIQRPPNRIFRLVCDNGVILWDWTTHLVRVYVASEKKWIEIPERGGYDAFPVEEMYENEMKQFVATLNGNEIFPSTFHTELKLLEIMYKSERS